MKNDLRKKIRRIIGEQSEKTYDSTKDTTKHIERVQELTDSFCDKLKKQVENHDKTKLNKEEKPYFDEATPKLKKLTYGSPEYKESLKSIKKALKHHYKMNSHHPEHYKNGVDDMTLFDIVEMFVDWKAATERHHDGNIFKSIKDNKKRFKMSDQLSKIFENTAEKMGWKK